MARKIIRLFGVFRPDDVCAGVFTRKTEAESLIYASSDIPLRIEKLQHVGTARANVLSIMRKRGWRILHGVFTASPSRAKCHCCGIRQADPYDPEKRCGHKDCIPF
jgi:hypothetical protein